MATWVVTSGVTSNVIGLSLNERRGSSTDYALTGTTHSPGRIITTSQQCGPWLGGMHGSHPIYTQRWQRVGTNRWVNEWNLNGRTGVNTHNLRRVNGTPGTPMRVNASIVPRRGPGTFFAQNTTIAFAPGTTVIPTHSINVNGLGLSSTGNQGVWFRVGDQRWLHSSRLS